MISYRMWVPDRIGRSLEHFNSPVITSSSVVHVSASEATTHSPSLFGGSWQSWASFIGAASITVQNVSVRNGGVDFYVVVDWRSPLHLSLDITVLDPPAAFVIGR
jgi:hypothetical protein